MSEDKPYKEPWHLDRRVPISLIIALIVQTGAIFYWGGQMESRLSAVESDTNGTPYGMSIAESVSAHKILQVQIEGNKDTANEIKGTLTIINNKLDRLIERVK